MNLTEPLSIIMPGLDGPVLRVLSRTTLPLTGSRVADLVHSSKTGVRKALSRFVDQGIVNVQRAGASLLYVANREHVAWPAIEEAIRASDAVIHTLEQKIVAELTATFSPTDAANSALAIFGSVARGTSTQRSDIDILLISEAADTEQLVDSLIENVPRWSGNTCNVLALNMEQLTAMKVAEDPMIGSLQSDSRTLYGRDVQRMLADL